MSQRLPAPVRPPVPERTSLPWLGRVRSRFDVRWLGLLAAIAITASVLLFHDQFARLGALGYPGLFIISFAGNATVFLPAPSLALVFASGGSFFPPLVGLAAGTGEALGEMTGYLAGIAGRTVIENRTRYGQMQRWMERRGLWVIFVLSVIPNPLFDLAGVVAGSMKVPAWRFLLACWPGKILKTMAAAYLGSQAINLMEWLGQAAAH